MAKILQEDLEKLQKIHEGIGIAKMQLDNASLVFELEKSKLEIARLTLYRKYNLLDSDSIKNDGEIVAAEKKEPEVKE